MVFPWFLWVSDSFCYFFVLNQGFSKWGVRHLNGFQGLQRIYLYIAGVCVCSRLNHALTAPLIEFIFGMHIDVIPGSYIVHIILLFNIIKDHLWKKYIFCDIPLHLQLINFLAARAAAALKSTIFLVLGCFHTWGYSL